MGIFGIAGGILGQIASAANPNPNKQQIKQGFQLLGQDLQSGNLSQAKSDFASLQRLIPGGEHNTLFAPTSSGAQSGNPLATAVSQLAQDLKSGNLSAAQSDFANAQQDLQQAVSRLGGPHGHHHRHHGSDESSQSSSQLDPISTLFGQLGQDLQAGNVAAAQQAYASLQQDLHQFGHDNFSIPTASSASAGSALNISA